jgi:hypothetical protein
MAEVFSDSGSLFLTAVFFQPILPFSLILAFLGNVLSYWSLKYILLRRSRRPRELSENLPIFFAGLIPFMVTVWTGSTLFFYKQTFDLQEQMQQKSLQKSADYNSRVVILIVALAV